MKNKKNVRVFIILSCVIVALLATTASKGDVSAEHAIGLSTTSAETIDVSPRGTGTTISETEINVTTTCQAGYNLSFSTTVNDNNLYLNGDPDSINTGNYFSPSDGTTSLVSANNTWGYYLPGLGGEAPTIDSIFLPVPTTGNTSMLRTPTQTASATEINDTFSMYYGVKVSNTLLSGQYTMKKDENENEGTIVYYATLPEDCFMYTIEYDPTGTNTGTSVTGTGSIGSQRIYEGVSANITSETYGNPTIDGIDYYFIGWNTAQDGTGISYTGGEPIIDLAPPYTSIILYAQWASCQSGKICYHKNNSNAEGAMEYQAATSNTSITLLPSNYSLENQGFIGWSEDKNAATKLINHEAVTIYGTNETISLGELPPFGLPLYAVWLEANDTLQGWTGCDTLEIGETIALRDARDNNTYGVAKLADGKCWTIENMRIDDSVDADAMIAGSDSLGYNFSILPASSNEWNNNNTVLQFNNSNTVDGLLAYGNYYSWSSAIASTANYDIQTADTSICPSGWRLPQGGQALASANNDYYNLIKSLTNEEPNMNQSTGNGYYSGTNYSNAIRKYPYNFVFSGRWEGNTASMRGEAGFYWTSTSQNVTGTDANYLYLNNAMVRPGNGHSDKYYGDAFRCIVND